MGTADEQRDLLDREAALAVVDDALARGRRGDGALLVVRGAPGVGKTALLDAAAARAASAGTTVLRAAGAELETELPFGLVRRMLTPGVEGLDDVAREALARDPAGAAVRLVASGGRGSGTGPGVLDGVHWFLADAARTTPLLVLLDDLHWADAPSVQAALYLGRRLDGLPLTLLVAGRPGDAVDAVRSLDGAGDLELPPLHRDAIATLVADVAGTAVDEDTAAACEAATGGNPLLVIELARALADEGGPRDADRVRALADRATPSLADAVRRRVRRLSPLAVRVAEAVAVLGDGSELRHVAQQAGLTLEETLDGVELLVGDAVLSDEVPPSFVHPLVRSAVLAGLPGARLAAAHRRAADVLRDTPAEWIATHLLLAPPAGEPATVALLREAAAVARERGAHATAVRLLGRAVAEPPAPGERAHVLAALGSAALAAGDAGQATAALGEAAGLLPDGSGDLGPVLLDLAGALSQRGETRAAVEALDPGRLDGEAALRVRVERTALGLYVDDLAAESLRQMRAFERLEGRTPAERLALATAALSRAFDPGSAATDAHGLAVRALADGTLLAEQTADASQFGNACYALVFAEDLDRAERESELAADDARRRRSAFAFTTASLGLQQICLLSGRLVEAIAHGDSVLGAAPEVRETPVALRWLSFAVRLQVEALLATGAADAAAELVATWEATGDLDRVDLFALRHARGLLRAAEGRHEAALTDHLAFGAIAARAGYEDRTTPWRLTAARAASALGREDEARALAAQELAITARWGTPGGHGQALHVAALLGPPDDAADALDAAIERLRRSALQLALARALVDAGRARRRIQDRDAARRLLEEGMTLASRCGAVPLRDRAREELVVLGARPRRYQTDGVEGLTPSELRVARLAAGGASNREIAQALFVTQKTVENHLTRGFRKLGIRSRGELGEALADGPAERG